MTNLDRNTQDVNPNNERRSLLAYDPWWVREEELMAINDDTPDLLGIEREELYFKWFYDERAKFQRGEPAMVRHEGNVTYILANEKGNGHDLKSTPINVTFFPDQSALRMVAKNMTLYQLRDLILLANKASKGELLWLKLASFGNRKSNKNCLRHNANTRSISGIELDYDAKVMTLDEAIGITQKARLRALLYTSANYSSATPKWRILLPTSKSLPPQMRAKLVARVNGLFGGIFDDASFTLSQAFYFGSVNHNPEHRAEITEGDFIDLRDDLDAGAVGRQGKKPNGDGGSSLLLERDPDDIYNYLFDELGPQRPEQTEANQDRVWDALCHIPSNLIRTEWIGIGMALHWLQWVDDDGCDWGKEHWDEWSATSEGGGPGAEGGGYKGPDDIERCWDSFHEDYDGPNGPVTIAKVYSLAREHGWDVGEVNGEAAQESSGVPLECNEENQKRVGKALMAITGVVYGSEKHIKIGKALQWLHWKLDGNRDRGLIIWNSWSQKLKGYTNPDDLVAIWNGWGEHDVTINYVFEIGEKKAPEFRSYFLEEVHQRLIVDLQWIVEDFIVAGTLNGLFGDGGIGKDLLLLQLAMAMTCDATWLGRRVKQGKVMFFPVEDDLDELRRRENNIANYFIACGMYHPVPKQLKITPVIGEKTLLGHYDPRSGLVKPTPEYTTLCNMIGDFKPDLVITGNRVDIFGVNQNDDAQAKQCIKLLTSICVTYKTAVMMPSHVSLNRSSADQGTSGSVQWNNGCRMRDYLRKPEVDKKEGGEPEDPTARELQVMKANYAPTGQMIAMNWKNGVFQTDPVFEETVERERKDPVAEQIADEEEVLRMLDDLVEGDHVSPKHTAPNNIYKAFSKKGRFKGNQGKLEAAFKRLLAKGTLDVFKEGPPSRVTHRVVRA